MDFLGIQNRVLNRCGSLGSADVRGRVKLEIAHVQDTILEQAGSYMPWFLLSPFVNLTLLEDSNWIALPSDFLQEMENSQPWYATDAAWVKIHKNPFDAATAFLEATSGPPRFYEVQPQGYWFHPKADKDYTIRVRYFRKEAALVNDTDENAWTREASDLLIAETGRLICTYHLKDLDRAALFERDAEKARSRLFIRSAAIENTNRLTSMGED